MLFWIGFFILIVGLVLAAKETITLMIMAFETSIAWGITVLFIPLVIVLFSIYHWDKAGKPFVESIKGTAIVVVGTVMMFYFR